MQLSVRCVVRSAVLSFLFSLVLVVLFGFMGNALGRVISDPTGIEVTNGIIGFVVRSYAGVVGARAAIREETEPGGVLLSAVIGLGVGYVVFQLLNAVLEIVALGRSYDVDVLLPIGLVVWAASGLAGAAFALVRSQRRRR